VREHRTALARILNDDRLSPNRRLLAEVLALYIDADQEKRKYAGDKTPEDEFDEVAAARDKALIHDLIRSEFIDQRGFRFTEKGEGVEEERQTKIEKEAVETMKSVFNSILGDAPSASTTI
jgi:hypothetical protein